MTETNTAALEGLAVKLHGVELSESEADLLDELLRRAASSAPEVEGFGVVFEIETTFRRPGGNSLLTDDGTLVLANKLAVGLGLDPKGVWTDMRPLS